MVKRGEFGLYSGAFRFRVSKPGVAVDSAGASEFLLHESDFLGQIMQVGYVARPASTPYEVTVNYNETLDFKPIVMLWHVNSSIRTFPCPIHYHTGTGTVYFTQVWVTPGLSSMLVGFNYGYTDGAYYQIIRRVRD